MGPKPKALQREQEQEQKHWGGRSTSIWVRQSTSLAGLPFVAVSHSNGLRASPETHRHRSAQLHWRPSRVPSPHSARLIENILRLPRTLRVTPSNFRQFLALAWVAPAYFRDILTQSLQLAWHFATFEIPIAALGTTFLVGTTNILLEIPIAAVGTTWTDRREMFFCGQNAYTAITAAAMLLGLPTLMQLYCPPLARAPGVPVLRLFFVLSPSLFLFLLNSLS